MHKIGRNVRDTFEKLFICPKCLINSFGRLRQKILIWNKNQIAEAANQPTFKIFDRSWKIFPHFINFVADFKN